MEIKKVKLGEIKPYFNNPRDNRNAVAPTKESIERYGFNKPIMVDKNGVIICGHTRYLAAFHMGLTEVPVVYSDMGEERAKAFRILDNKIAEKGYYDEDALANELRSMSTPEEMQAFFFEDIKDIINIDANQFTSGSPFDGGYDAGEEENYGGGTYENESQEEDNYGSGYESEEEDDTPPSESAAMNEVYKPYVKDGKTYMNVVCPYCGNVETIEL